jgi:hypothetical protein
MKVNALTLGTAFGPSPIDVGEKDFASVGG